MYLLLSLHDGPFYKRTAEGVVTLKARAKPVTQWWKKNGRSEPHEVLRDIFVETASAKFGGNPPGVSWYSTRLGQQAAPKSSTGDQTHHKQQ